MKRVGLLSTIGLLAFGTLPAVQAERGYATDSCTAPVQSGPAPGYKIVRMISSGTSLDILEPNSKGYTKVRTPDGTIGWMMSEYLMEQPSARNRVTQFETRITTLENENKILKGENEELNITRENSNRCGQELANVRHTASKTLAIDEENRRIQQEIEISRKRQEQLESENTTLRDQSNRNWFLTGAGTALGGLVCGLVLPHLSMKRRRRWDQF
jgi:SH3 domain protein